MRFAKFLKEDAGQLAVPGMATKHPHVWGSNDPSTVAGKPCPPDKVWNEAKQKCETALGTREIRMTGPGMTDKKGR